jgi:hypothetical protein
MGPTSSGSLRRASCERFPVEIVSVDSAQVYRGMDIDGKPDARRARGPHHLIDILDPVEAYSAARFRSDAIGRLPRPRARRHSAARRRDDAVLQGVWTPLGVAGGRSWVRARLDARRPPKAGRRSTPSSRE